MTDARSKLPWDSWQYVMMTHTLSLEETDAWCACLAKEAGLKPDEVDWASYAGRAVVKAAKDREKVVSAVYLHLDELRKLFQAALDRLKFHPGRNQHIGMLLDEGGTLIPQCSFRLYPNEKKVFGF